MTISHVPGQGMLGNAPESYLMKVSGIQTQIIRLTRQILYLHEFYSVGISDRINDPKKYSHADSRNLRLYCFMQPKWPCRCKSCDLCAVPNWSFYSYCGGLNKNNPHWPVSSESAQFASIGGIRRCGHDMSLGVGFEVFHKSTPQPSDSLFLFLSLWIKMWLSVTALALCLLRCFLL